MRAAETTATDRFPPSQEGTPRAAPPGRSGGVPFSLREHDLAGDCREIVVEGDLDLAVLDRLDAALARADRRPAILIDLAGCAFIDVTATTLILAAHRRARGEDRRLVIRGAGGQILRLLTALGLTGDGLLCEPPGREAPA